MEDEILYFTAKLKLIKSVLLLVMARYGRGGKRWIRYDTVQNIAMRYDMIYAVCNDQQSKINARSRWRVHMRSNAINGRRHSNAVHNLRQRSNVGDGTVSEI